MAKSARKLGFKPSLVDMADLDVTSLKNVKRLIVIAATWGEGEPPARATRTYKELMSEAAPRLDGVEFGVLALGDTAYVEFCEIGKALDARLEALGAKRVADRVDCDLDFAEPAAKWIDGTLKVLAPDVAPDAKVIAVDFTNKAAPNLDVVEAEVSETINLNSSRSEKETYHLELTFDGPAPAYKPGNSLDLYAENDPAYVDALLRAARVSDAALRADFIKSRDVTTLSLKTLETYAGFGQRYVKELLDAGTAKNWIAGRQLIDLIQEFPVALDPEKLRALTRPLAPRAYSIASSRAEVGDEAHLLISKVGYSTHNRARKGVASNYAAGLKKGARVRVKLKPNKHFALPARRPRHHHGRPRHRRRAISCVCAGAPRQQREGPQLAVLRRPAVHARLPLPDRVAGRPEGRRPRRAWMSRSRATRRRRSTCSIASGRSARDVDRVARRRRNALRVR